MRWFGSSTLLFYRGILICFSAVIKKKAVCFTHVIITNFPIMIERASERKNIPTLPERRSGKGRFASGWFLLSVERLEFTFDTLHICCLFHFCLEIIIVFNIYLKFGLPSQKEERTFSKGCKNCTETKDKVKLTRQKANNLLKV